MDDRTLLTLAAKAAGIELSHWNDGQEPYSSGLGFILPCNRMWNPLADDGDALRMAVKLGLKIEHHDNSVVVWFDYFGTGYIPYDGDACKATRRAIVQSAAEIGEEMS
jgi:hypothetical protein